MQLMGFDCQMATEIRGLEMKWDSVVLQFSLHMLGSIWEINKLTTTKNKYFAT